MPPINHVAISAGVAAVTVAMAAAIAIYENEELQRYATQIRRRLAMALHSLGNELDPSQMNDLPPLFNRPEDAEGFLMSSRGGAASADADADASQGGDSGEVDADEATQRRQREELMYWNAMRESKLEAERPAPAPRPRGVSFDDFLKPDTTGENGTFVVSSGAQVGERDGLVRRNPGGGGGGDDGRVQQGLAVPSAYANPFSDDQQVEEERMTRSMLAPTDDEMSDIYSTTTADNNKEGTPAGSLSRTRNGDDALIEFASDSSTTSTLSGTLEGRPEDPFSAAAEEDADPAFGMPGPVNYRSSFADIDAWADRAEFESREDQQGLWSPPAPSAPPAQPGASAEAPARPDDMASVSEAELINAEDARSADEHGVMSDSDDGVHTPGSWSEVGSEVSESELSMRGRAAERS